MIAVLLSSLSLLMWTLLMLASITSLCIRPFSTVRTALPTYSLNSREAARCNQTDRLSASLHHSLDLPASLFQSLYSCDRIDFCSCSLASFSLCPEVCIVFQALTLRCFNVPSRTEFWFRHLWHRLSVVCRHLVRGNQINLSRQFCTFTCLLSFRRCSTC